MDTSNPLPHNAVFARLCEKRALFHCFDEVYLFGSSLQTGAAPGDIDLLLVYEAPLPEILEALPSIESTLQKTFQLPIDLTVLSRDELQQTNFLRRIQSFQRVK